MVLLALSKFDPLRIALDHALFAESIPLGGIEA